MARLALLVLACLLAASANAAPVATVTVAAKFSELSPTGTWQYLSYVTNTTWLPLNQRWDCTQTPGICSGASCGYDGRSPYLHLESALF